MTLIRHFGPLTLFHMAAAGPHLSLNSSCEAAVDVAVIGAGISGLVAAAQLHKHRLTVAVLEARTRVGGRLHSPNGVDLGGSWLWTSDHRTLALAKSLDVPIVEQQLAGDAFGQQVQAGPVLNYGNAGDRMAPCGPGAMRCLGGYGSLTHGLTKQIPAETVQSGRQVLSLTANERGGVEGVIVKHQSVKDGEEPKLLFAKYVIVALPPAIASQLQYTPALPGEKAQMMAETMTWCAKLKHNKMLSQSCTCLSLGTNAQVWRLVQGRGALLKAILA